MKNASNIALLALTVLGACAAARPEEPWRLELRTSGGFTGRGNGTYSIDWKGKVTADRPGLEPCTFQATAEELRRVARLLGEARPSTWKESYLPELTCCDRFIYSLTVEEGKKVVETQWIDAPPPMPKDLLALDEAIYRGEESIRAASEDRCR